MKIWYEVWGMDDDEAELSLYYKFPVPEPSQEAAVRETAQAAADQLTNNDVRRVEVRRVEEP